LFAANDRYVLPKLLVLSSDKTTAIDAVSLVSEFSNYEAAIAVSLLVNSLTCRHLKEETSFTQRGGNSKSIEPTHFGLIGK